MCNTVLAPGRRGRGGSRLQATSGWMVCAARRDARPRPERSSLPRIIYCICPALLGFHSSAAGQGGAAIDALALQSTEHHLPCLSRQITLAAGQKLRAGTPAGCFTNTFVSRRRRRRRCLLAPHPALPAHSYTQQGRNTGHRHGAAQAHRLRPGCNPVVRGWGTLVASQDPHPCTSPLGERPHLPPICQPNTAHRPSKTPPRCTCTLSTSTLRNVNLKPLNILPPCTPTQQSSGSLPAERRRALLPGAFPSHIRPLPGTPPKCVREPEMYQLSGGAPFRPGRCDRGRPVAVDRRGEEVGGQQPGLFAQTVAPVQHAAGGPRLRPPCCRRAQGQGQGPG